MSFQEKRSIANLISTILIFIFYYFNVIQEPGSWSFLESENEYSLWGKLILFIIPVQIVGSIIIHIVFVVINKIITNEDEPEIVDEFDKIIELKTTRNSLFIFVLGFLGAMGTVAMNMDAKIMFYIFFFTMFLTGIMGESTQIYYYRKGV